jgi:hypothetical protein
MMISPLAPVAGNSVTIGSDATQDLWSLMAASANKLILHGWEISSDAVAATLLDVALFRITAAGSGGALTAGEQPLDSDDAAAVGIARVGDTTPGTPGVLLACYQWEQLGPLGMIYTPEMRPVIEVSTGIALVCNTADGFEMSGWICWEEI